MININKSSLRKIMIEYKKLHKFSHYQDEQINTLKQENESLKLENIDLKK